MPLPAGSFLPYVVWTMAFPQGRRRRQPASGIREADDR